MWPPPPPQLLLLDAQLLVGEGDSWLRESDSWWFCSGNSSCCRALSSLSFMLPGPLPGDLGGVGEAVWLTKAGVDITWKRREMEESQKTELKNKILNTDIKSVLINA